MSPKPSSCVVSTGSFEVPDNADILCAPKTGMRSMVEKRDQQFFDGFMILVGVFVGLIAGVLMFGNLL